MSTLDSKPMDRRKATGKIVRVVALATGLSVMEVERLLAQGSYKPRKPTITKPTSPKPTTPTVKVNAARQLIVSQKSVNSQLANLKVLLENSAEVYENEFGRLTPVETMPADQMWENIPDDMTGDMVNVCAANFDPSGFMEGALQGLHWCGSNNTCTGQELTGQDPEGESCAGVNTCNGQSCTGMSMCEDNTCDGQDCAGLGLCDENNQKIASAEFLETVNDDLFVQLLFKEFHVQTAEALAAQINSTLHDIATGQVTHWPPD